MTTTILAPEIRPENSERADISPRGAVSPRTAALRAGIGYVSLFGLAIFANFFVREGLVVADDAQATATNIAESNTLFRWGLVAFLAIFLIDIVVAWALHIVFRTQHHDLSLVAAWSRLVSTVFLGVAAIFLFQAFAFYDSAAVADVMSSGERNAQALVGLELFNSAWLVGLAAFGLHLILLGLRTPTMTHQDSMTSLFNLTRSTVASSAPHSAQPSGGRAQRPARMLGLRHTHGPLFAFVGASTLLAMFFAAGIFLDQRVITGAPAWVKPTKFAVSIAVYAGTLLWILSLVRRDTRRRDRFVRWTGGVVASTLAVELVLIGTQVVRGVPSHFNQATGFDAAVFTIMGSSIVALFVANLAVAVVVVRERLDDRPMASAIRLGLVIASVGMAFGYLMTMPTAQQAAAMDAGLGIDMVGAHSVGVTDGGAGLPFVGWSTEGGDLRIGHFIGMHALQVLPLLALGMRGRGSVTRQVGTVRVAAASYLGLSVLVTWQALRAQPLLHPDALTLAAVAGLLVFTVAALAVVRAQTPSAAQ